MGEATIRQAIMAYDERPLDNPINWSFRVGRLFGIDIRVHIAFVICAVVLLWMELRPTESAGSVSFSRLLGGAVGTYLVLFLIVLLHEFGHCFGARAMGGEADEILLWPLGGLASVSPPHQPHAHMVTTLAGPLVNVTICALCSAILVLWMGSAQAVPWNPLHPMQPWDGMLVPTAGQEWILRVYGVSYVVLLINLLPIFPFDGGRVLQAWLWPRKGYRPSMVIATGVGMVGAIVVGLFGLFTGQDWLFMLVAVFGYMTCWQTRRLMREQGEFGVSGPGATYAPGIGLFEQDSGPAQRKPGFFERRRLRKAALQVQRERTRRAAHDKAVEEILRKVSQSGLGSLTARERRILEEETERQRTLER